MLGRHHLKWWKSILEGSLINESIRGRDDIYTIKNGKKGHFLTSNRQSWLNAENGVHKTDYVIQCSQLIICERR